MLLLTVALISLLPLVFYFFLVFMDRVHPEFFLKAELSIYNISRIGHSFYICYCSFYDFYEEVPVPFKTS